MAADHETRAGEARAEVVPQLVSLYAKQPEIHARSVSGLYARWRWAFVWLTQLVFYGLPWITWSGRPAVLFDLDARRFYLGPLVLYPQDFIYLTALLAICAYALFLFTAIAGRLWCGFACPQTVYTEMFTAVERWFEGDRGARLRLRAGPWTAERALRQGGKHLAWLAIALATGISFVAYFTPMRELLASIAALALSGWEWFWLLFYALATYGNAGFLREQVCKYMCPYARFQSAMFDRRTLIVSYDAQRGEPRGLPAGKVRNKAASGAAPLGDCIDCSLCVQVCPTGIDIRRGLQYECIGCAACIDACDGVMAKLDRPLNLIRFATQEAPSGAVAGPAWHMLGSAITRPRVLVYGAVLLLISGLLGWSLWQRPLLRADVVRDRAALARQVEHGFIENVYRLQLMNASEAVQHVSLVVLDAPGASLKPQVHGRHEWTLAPVEARWVTVALRVPPTPTPPPGVHPIQLELSVSPAPGVSVAQARKVIEKTTFVVPR